MKVRIGFGTGVGAGAPDPGRFRELVDGLEALGFDSLWLPERLTGPIADPLVALSVAAGRTERLKLGTSVLVLPGRNPAVVAKAMASLDALSAGRFLPAVGLGGALAPELAAFGVERTERASWFDEALPLMRAWWRGEAVHHEGKRFRFDGVSLAVRPHQDPLEVWLGGQAPSELRRVGRLGDGWLPSYCTPDDVAAGWALINETARAHGRRIDPEHLGAMVVWSEGEVPERARLFLTQRRPDLAPSDVFPIGLDALRARLEAFIAAGASKFVVTPLDEPATWEPALRKLADAVGDLQT